nr:signal peptidase I [Oceanispirochaeta sp. M1]
MARCESRDYPIVFSSSSRRAIPYREKKAIASRRIRRTVFLILVFITFLIFTNYASTALKVVSSSMEPGLNPGDRILFSKLLLDTDIGGMKWVDLGIKRGDLVVISPPYFRKNQQFIQIVNPLVQFITFQKIQLSSYPRYSWEKTNMIKRVIAVPGDSVRMVNHRVYLKTPKSSKFRYEEDVIEVSYNWKSVDTPGIWIPGYPLDGSSSEITLEEGEFFVLSDFRGQGSDSYLWGPLSSDRILGKVFFRYWPFNAFSFL